MLAEIIVMKMLNSFTKNYSYIEIMNDAKNLIEIACTSVVSKAVLN